jgi:hypothetical protein
LFSNPDFTWDNNLRPYCPSKRGWQLESQQPYALQLASARVTKAGFAGDTLGVKKSKRKLATHFSRHTTQAAGKQNKL